MSKTIYQSKITQIGDFATEALSDGMLITFREGAPEDLADYCFIHSHDVLLQVLSTGQTLQLGNKQYAITAVGEVATQNLKELGHITVRFDGSKVAELPGCIHVSGEIPTKLALGDEIIILID